MNKYTLELNRVRYCSPCARYVIHAKNINSAVLYGVDIEISAKLIESAPALLIALKDMIEYVREIECALSMDGYEIRATRVRAAEEVVFKAEGSSNE